MIPGSEQQIAQLDSIAKDSGSPPEEPVDSDCAKYVLAKKYRAIDEMEEDNGKDTYFDKQYDKTFYELYNEYKKYVNDPQMPKEGKIAILTEKLMENIGMSEKDAQRDAIAFLDKKRIVINGDYCVVILSDDSQTKYLYYKRVENTFIIFAEDYVPRWINSLCALDHHSVACSDKFGNVFVPPSS